MGEASLLGECLARLDWSPEKLAREINRVCGSVTISLKAPYGWLHGSCPRGKLPQVVASILTKHLGEPVAVEALWPNRRSGGVAILSADDGLDVPWTQQGAWQCSMILTTNNIAAAPSTLLPITGASLIAPAVDWLTAAIEPFQGRSKGEQVSPQAVDVLADRVSQLRRLDDVQGGPLVLDWVLQDLRWTASLVRDGAYDEPTGTRLHVILGELAQLGGWLAVDLGRYALGQRLLLVALRMAHAAGDRALGAHVISCLSYQAIWTGHHSDALRLIQIARKGFGSSGGAVGALLATRQARAHAQLGHIAAFERALTDSAAQLENADTSTDPAWSYWITPAVLAADAGRSWLDLGRADRAKQDLTRGLALFGDTLPRNRLLHHLSLAETRLALDDVDAAADAANAALDLGMHQDSGRARSRLRRLRDGFARRGSGRSREIRDRADHLLSA